MRRGVVSLQTRGMMPGTNKDVLVAVSRDMKSRDRKSRDRKSRDMKSRYMKS
jgi:hypothetical protein